MGGFLEPGEAIYASPTGNGVGFQNDPASLSTALASGRNIYLLNGTYTGGITVSNPITMQAAPGHSPVIDGSGTNNPTITVSADAAIKGLSIVGSYALGEGNHFMECNVYSGNASAITIENCSLTNFNHCAIKTAGKLTARNNTISHGGYSALDHGIYIRDANGSEISGNEISGASGWGIHAYNYAYNAVISGNNIHDNHGGILVTGEGHTITGNTITNNSGGHGIDFFHYGLIGLTVTGNTLSGNTAYDMYLDAGAGEGFTNCTISGNTGTKNW